MTNPSLINLSALRAIARNNEPFVREVLAVFRDNTPKDLEKLASHVVQGDAQMVRYFSHKLKSSCFTIGFGKGYTYFKDLETSADLGETHKWQGIMDEANASCAAALDEIGEILIQPL